MISISHLQRNSYNFQIKCKTSFYTSNVMSVRSKLWFILYRLVNRQRYLLLYYTKRDKTDKIRSHPRTHIGFTKEINDFKDTNSNNKSYAKEWLTFYVFLKIGNTDNIKSVLEIAATLCEMCWKAKVLVILRLGSLFYLFIYEPHRLFCCLYVWFG